MDRADICWPHVGVLLLGLTIPFGAAAAEVGDTNWPAFRGHRASGVAEGFETPVRWSVASQDNIKWRVPVPGLAHSAPIVWDNRVFVTTAIRASGKAKLKPGLYGDITPVADLTRTRWVLLCFDRETGEILWERTAHEGLPTTKRHPKSSHANPTPATDRKHVVAFFGSEGIYCYDTNGVLLWKKDLGLLDSGFYRAPAAQWGFGSSPVIYKGLVIVQCDVQKGSFLAALDITNGQDVWRTPRDDVPTWSTPTIDVRPGRAQVIVNGYKHIGGYDLRSGAELWRMAGGGDIPVPTPVVGHGLIYFTSAHGGMSPICAIQIDAEGDLGQTSSSNQSKHIAWCHERGGNYMQTPLVYGQYVYLCSDRGVLSCLNAVTGDYIYKQKLPIRSSFTASPVAGDGKIYLTAENGSVAVVKAGAEFQLVATNDLGESCLATPAISRGRLFFRTRHHLVAVSD